AVVQALAKNGLLPTNLPSTRNGLLSSRGGEEVYSGGVACYKQVTPTGVSTCCGSGVQCATFFGEISPRPSPPEGRGRYPSLPDRSQRVPRLPLLLWRRGSGRGGP